MSATASRIALVVPAHPIPVPKPSTTASGAARGIPRDRVTGRFAPRAPIPVCAGCHYTLAESLAGGLYCPAPKCEAYRVTVDVVPGVRLGTLTAEDLEVAR